jgi:hypothetical protein
LAKNGAFLKGIIFVQANPPEELKKIGSKFGNSYLKTSLTAFTISFAFGIEDCSSIELYGIGALRPATIFTGALRQSNALW